MFQHAKICLDRSTLGCVDMSKVKSLNMQINCELMSVIADFQHQQNNRRFSKKVFKKVQRKFPNPYQ